MWESALSLEFGKRKKSKETSGINLCRTYNVHVWVHFCLITRQDFSSNRRILHALQIISVTKSHFFFLWLPPNQMGWVHKKYVDCKGLVWCDSYEKKKKSCRVWKEYKISHCFSSKILTDSRSPPTHPLDPAHSHQNGPAPPRPAPTPPILIGGGFLVQNENHVSGTVDPLPN